MHIHEVRVMHIHKLHIHLVLVNIIIHWRTTLSWCYSCVFCWF